MLKPECAQTSAPVEGAAKWHGAVVSNASRAARTASERSPWQQLLCRWVQPLAAAAAILTTGVETFGQDVVGVAEIEPVNALAPRDADALAGGVEQEGLLDEFISLDPSAGFGNIAQDSFFAESAFRSRVSTVRAPGRFGGWTVDLGDVALHINDFAVKDGFGNAVDLNGTRAGSLYQSINVKAGVKYRIRFQMSGNWTTFPGRPRALSVFFGNEKASFVMNKPTSWSRTNMQWEEKTIDFVAQQDVVGLRFASNTEGIPDGPVISQVEMLSPLTPPGALDSIPVPLPPNLSEFVQNRDKAIALGKALFWDMQVGSDGRTACATCHWHAGADVRTVNTVNPGSSGSLFRGVNKALKSSDFPFHKFRDPTIPGDKTSNPVIEDRREVTGSQGVVTEDFVEIKSGSSQDEGKFVLNPTFNSDNADVRQVTGRNAPTSVNAVYFDRSFWDGRANRYFNGVNPFGELDPNAHVLKANAAGEIQPVKIQLDNAALASQAVGPPNSDVEMAWNGRTFAALGRKMLSLQPLSQQMVAADDSVLGVYRDASGRGLDLSQAAYAKLIREAFLPEWWSGTAKTSDGYTQMEANFSMFWGLAIMMYESTLVSDQTPYDKFARGDKDALTAKAKAGLRIFVQEGKCLNCHHGPEFAGGTISTLRGVLSEDGGVSLMPMEQGLAFYDEGFYNIGVRPTTEDPGVGGAHPLLGPWSYSRQEQAGRNPDPHDVVTADRRVAVDGAFKAPTLRNVELTGPYMHNGSMKSLTEVVQFYARGSDFRESNLKDLDSDVNGVPSLQGNPDAIAAVVEFLEHLTDPRVKHQRAPFDHPELVLPNGHLAVTAGVALDQLLLLPATGKDGGSPLTSFESVLTNGLGLAVLQMQEPPRPVDVATEDAVDSAATSTPSDSPVSTPAAESAQASLVKTPFDAATLARKASEKQALLGNRSSKASASVAPATPEIAEIVDAEVADAEVVETAVAGPETQAVTPEADAAEMVLPTGAPEALPEVTEADVVPETIPAGEASEVELADETITDGTEELQVTTVESPVAEETAVGLEKNPLDPATLAEKMEEKEALLGDRSSPEEKEELLGNRTSSVLDPIAIGLPDDADADEAAEVDGPEMDEEADDASEVDAPVTEVDADADEAVEVDGPEMDGEADDASEVDAPVTEVDADADEVAEVDGPAMDEEADDADEVDAPVTEVDADADEAAEVDGPEMDEEADDAAEVDAPVTEVDADADEAAEVDGPAMDEEADDAAEVDAPVTEVDADADEAVEVDGPEMDEEVDEAPEVDTPADTEEPGDTDAPESNNSGLTKSPPDAATLAAKAAEKAALLGNRSAPEEKDELLGNRTSPDDKDDVLGDRTSTILDPIAIGEAEEQDEAAEVDAPVIDEEAAEAPEVDVVVVPDVVDEAAEVDAPVIDEEAAEAPEVDVVVVPDMADEAAEVDAPVIDEESAEATEVNAPVESEEEDGVDPQPTEPTTTSLRKTALTAQQLAARAAAKAALLGNRRSRVIDSVAPNNKPATDANEAHSEAPVGRSPLKKVAPDSSVTAAKSAEKAALLGNRNSKTTGSIASAKVAPAEVEESVVVETVITEPLVIETVSEAQTDTAVEKTTVVNGKGGLRSARSSVKPAATPGKTGVSTGKGASGSGRARNSAYRGLTRPRGEQ